MSAITQLVNSQNQIQLHACMVASVSQLDTLMISANKYLIENVIKQLKHLGGLESTQEKKLLLAAPGAIITHLSCSPNFPRVSILNEAG